MIPPRLAAAVAAVAALAGTAAYLVHGSGSTVPARTPARVELVYAKPIGTGLTVRAEKIYAATPRGARPVPLAEGMFPLLSPDGRWVAYTGGSLDHPGRLRLVSTLGGASRATRIVGGSAAWSPDSRTLAVAPTHGVVELLDVRTLRTRVLRLHPGGAGFSFSPDGSALAYETNGRHGPDIYSVTIKDGAVHRLTDAGLNGSPLWGPGGIAFERYTSDARGDIWLMNGDGTDARPLTHTHAGIFPAAWSADGSRLLAAHPATHNGRLYAVDVATGEARALTPFVGDLSPQGLSRDGRTVLASIGCGGTASPYGLLETIPFAGGRRRVIVRGPCAGSSDF